MDTHSSYFGSEAYARFQQMNADIFKVEAQARDLGFEEVRLALYRSRIELGHAETFVRGEYTRARIAEEDAPPPLIKGQTQLQAFTARNEEHRRSGPARHFPSMDPQRERELAADRADGGPGTSNDQGEKR